MPGNPVDETADEIPQEFFNNFMVKLRRAAHATLEQLSPDILVQYRDFVHQNPPPDDAGLMTFWQAHIPNYDQFYTEYVATWRREATKTLRAKRDWED